LNNLIDIYKSCRKENNIWLVNEICFLKVVEFWFTYFEYVIDIYEEEGIEITNLLNPNLKKSIFHAFDSNKLFHKEKKSKIEKIFNKIDKLATKGKDQIQEYYKLIDELVDKGEYSYLEQCLCIFYEIEASSFSNVGDIKTKTWNDILFLTNTSFSKKLKKLYDSKNVYQTAFDIHSDSVSIVGLVVSSPLSITPSGQFLRQ
jgi:hypothetical protein